jgi:hypothetical protein
LHSRLHEPLILMHSVRGKQQRERSRSGFRKGRIDNSPNMRLSKPKSRLTTQERGGNAPSIARGFGGKCRPVRDSKKQALHRDDVLEGRSTLAASGSHVFGHVRANFTNVPDRRGCEVSVWSLPGVTALGHRLTARPWDDYRQGLIAIRKFGSVEVSPRIFLFMSRFGPPAQYCIVSRIQLPG